MGLRTIVLIALAACAIPSFAEQMLTPVNGLQALEDVEQKLHKMLDAKADKTLLKIAAPVVEMVEKSVQEVESGNLTKKARSGKILLAINALQELQARLENVSKVDKIEMLRKNLSEKNAELTKEEDLLKVEKQNLEVLRKKKDAATSHQNATQKASQEESAVAGLLKMAHDLVSTRKGINMSMTGKAKLHESVSKMSTRLNVSNSSVADNKSMAVNGTTKVPTALQAILSNLQDQARKVSADLTHMDVDEKKREDAFDKQIGKHVPTTGSTDAINKGIAMIKQLKKQEQRSYKKARALRQSQLTELNEGVREVEAGDVAGLTSLLGKIQNEMKTLDSSAKGFLH